MKQFNRRVAAEYALKYALQANPAWPHYNSDCTSFVSQALYAGGWTMLRLSQDDSLPWRVTDTLAWYSGKAGSNAREQSWTWSNVNAFKEFLKWSGRAKTCSMWDLDLGDVVQLEDYGITHHTMIVTGLFADELNVKIPYVSYHSNDVRNKSLFDIQAEKFYYWKVLDRIKETRGDNPDDNVMRNKIF